MFTWKMAVKMVAHAHVYLICVVDHQGRPKLACFEASNSEM